MVRRKSSARQIGSFSWFGLSRIKETAIQFGSAAYQAATGDAWDQGNMRQRGYCSGQE